jgi:integrase
MSTLSPVPSTSGNSPRNHARGEEHNLVFTNKHGKPPNPGDAYTYFRQALDRAGLRPAKLHSTRHTFGSLVYNRGGDIKLVQSLLRHSAIQTTRIIYTHTRPETLAGALKLLDGLAETL